MSLSKSVKRLSRITGVQPKRFFRSARRLPGYVSALRELKRQSAKSSAKFPLGDLFPILDEKSQEAGSASGHYFHQDLLVAQRVFQNQPKRHIDVGSRVDGFVSHVATFREIEVLDVRPLESTTGNIKFLQADLMDDLPENLTHKADSVSCLHAIEHFGLGRYGDPINFEGHLSGLANLRKMVSDQGRLYLSTPISQRQRIEFNAHRVFSLPYLRSIIEPLFAIEAFATVDDRGQLHTDVDWQSPEANQTFGYSYGCGIFELIPRALPAVNAA